MGLLSIVLSATFGIGGLIFGIITVIRNKKQTIPISNYNRLYK